jgi:hypothetical protein
MQPPGMNDGVDVPEAPVQTFSNDVFQVTIGVNQSTGVFGGLISHNNNFAEQGLSSEHTAVFSHFRLLATSHRPEFGSGIVFGPNNEWYAFVDHPDNVAWAPLHLNPTLTMNPDRSGILTITEASSGKILRATVPADRILEFGTPNGPKVRAIVAQRSDLEFFEIGDTEAEGEAGDNTVAAAAKQYRHGVDAVFGELGEGDTGLA